MLSSTAEYALRIIITVAGSVGEPLTGEQIAIRTRVPTDYAVKILHQLGRAGLVHGRRGRGGGFRLACDPVKTTLLDVINVVDPLRRIEACPLGNEKHRHLCPMHRRLDDAIAYVQRTFGEVRLQDVIDSDGQDSLCQPPALNGHMVALLISGEAPKRLTASGRSRRPPRGATPRFSR